MFAVFCLLLLSSLGHCQDNDLPSRFEIESSINRTIEEVERQVREDSRLPRLTRQDIVKILENITSQDLNEFKDKEKFEQARNMYQRALMVVLPYSAEESAGNLKDLYTKPPMTKIIPDFLSESNKNEPEKGKMKKENNNAENSETLVTENLIANHHSYKIASKDFTTTMKNHYKNHRDTYSEVRTKMPLKDSLKMDSTPVRFTFNLENLQKGAFTTEKTTTRKYPIYDGSKSSDLEVVYSTSVTEEPVTKPASKEIAIDLERFKVNQNVLTSSQWRYNAPPSTTVKPTVSSSKLEKTPFLPTINTQLEDRLTVSSTREPEIRMKDSNVAEKFTLNSERATALFVTPMPTETSSKAKYSSTYSLNSTGFRQTLPTTAATITTTSMRPEVMDLLASIGLRPNNSNNVEDVYKRNKEILESEIKFPHLNSIHSLISGLISDRSNAVSIVNRNTFEKPGSEIKKGMENLTPDVQMLFKRFGLQTQNLVLQPTTTTTERTILNINSYTNFKPLPTSSVKDQEMKEFLAKFGLGIDVNRREKSMKPSTEIPSLIEAVPSNMRGILENIGLITNSQKTNRATIDPTEDRESTGTSKFHVFKPHEAVVNNEEQMSKINELLDTVKLVQQGKIDIQNVKKVANDLLRTTKTLKDGPDPLKLEEIIKSYNEDVRNEVKRQQDAEEKKETSTSTTTEQTTSSPIVTTELAETTLSVSTTTDSAVASSDQSKSATSTSTSTSTPNLMVLEESFGGTTKEPDTALPPRRKSGLYFLVDWNSFLEVGEDEKEKVNLRFAPKVGDRARFLPVTVP